MLYLRLQLEDLEEAESGAQQVMQAAILETEALKTSMQDHLQENQQCSDAVTTVTENREVLLVPGYCLETCPGCACVQD